MVITEYFLFAVHKGTVSNRLVGIIGSDHSLPIACSHGSYKGQSCDQVSECGFYALWESCLDVEEFFQHLYLKSIEGNPKESPNGLYVYKVTYDPKEYEFVEGWEHLEGGELRRPTIEELNPLVHGLAPWSGFINC